MNAIGIDVSKGKIMMPILRPYGEIVASPFDTSSPTCHVGKRGIARIWVFVRPVSDCMTTWAGIKV